MNVAIRYFSSTCLILTSHKNVRQKNITFYSDVKNESNIDNRSAANTICTSSIIKISSVTRLRVLTFSDVSLMFYIFTPIAAPVAS